MIEIKVPETKTEIRFNISGKTIGEIANELEATAEILRDILRTDETFTDGYCRKYSTVDLASVCPKPLPILHYETWEEDGPVYSGIIVTGYRQEAVKLHIDIAPDFMAWARTDKPLDEFCKKQIEEIRVILEEEQR